MSELEPSGELPIADDIWQASLPSVGLRVVGDAPVLDDLWGYAVYNLAPDPSLDLRTLDKGTQQVCADIGSPRANAVAIVIKPKGATEPLNVVGHEVQFGIRAVHGSGLLVAREPLPRDASLESMVGRCIVPLAPCLGWVAITSGMHYSLVNPGEWPLAVVHVSRPAFKPAYEELSGDPHVVGTLRSLGHGSRLGPG